MQINKKQEECLHKRYTIYHIRQTIYGIWYMEMYVCFCHSLSLSPSWTPSFASDLFLFSFRILFYLFLSLSIPVPLGFCGSCGFQQKSIIYVMAKHWRPQTGDCCSNIEQFVAIFFHSSLLLFSLRFCILCSQLKSKKGGVASARGVNRNIELNL